MHLWVSSVKDQRYRSSAAGLRCRGIPGLKACWRSPKRALCRCAGPVVWVSAIPASPVSSAAVPAIHLSRLIGLERAACCCAARPLLPSSNWISRDQERSIQDDRPGLLASRNHLQQDGPSEQRSLPCKGGVADVRSCSKYPPPTLPHLDQRVWSSTICSCRDLFSCSRACTRSSMARTDCLISSAV